MTSPALFSDRASEYAYTEADFQAIAAMVHAHAGICMPESKAMLVYSRLTKLLRDQSLSSFAEYVNLIRTDAVERGRAIEAMTTNHTKFFRENHHFEFFEREIRPAFLDRMRQGGRIRMWSSAASSGEEIYSLAMVLLGTDRREAQAFLNGDVALLATDLSESVLRTAQTGIYADITACDIPLRYKDVWTERHATGVAIAPAVRNLMRFRKLNLLLPWPMAGQFDVIFCRNVMIYFDEPTKELLLSRLAAQLAPGGYLFIGHSERLIGEASATFASIGQTIYRKNTI